MTIENILTSLQQRFPDVHEAQEKTKNYPSWFVPLNSIFQIIEILKTEFGFVYLDMITVNDRSGKVDPVKSPDVTSGVSPGSANFTGVNLQGFITSPNPNVYLQNVQNPSGTSQSGGYNPQTETPQQNNFFEVLYLVTSFSSNQKIFLITAVNRQNPELTSLYKIFKSADWQEREIFDLFGIKFKNHPNLKKILTPEFIEGFPLRKDYVHKKDKFD